MLALLSSFSSKVYLIIITSLITFLVTALISNWFKSNTIEKLRNEMVIEKDKTQQEKANNTVLKAKISEINKTIEMMGIDYQAKIDEFEAYKKKPIYKYKTIIKEIKSDECEDIKNRLDIIRNFTD